MSELTFHTSSSLGALQANFRLTLQDGYTVLVGPNDSGKSSILQLIFRNIVKQTEVTPHPPAVTSSNVCLLLPDRMYIDPSLESGGATFEEWNDNIAGQISTDPLNYSAQAGASRSQLPKLLLTHTSLYDQIGRANDYLRAIGFEEFRIMSQQRLISDSVHIMHHGTGMRSIFPILCALTDDQVNVLLIDEPEVALEPRLQKLLKEILYRASSEKKIVVSTHSHLFLNRSDLSRNLVVTRGDKGILVEQVGSPERLLDITFDMLGSSLEDLFFPRNFLVVEGSSDQILCESVLKLLGGSSSDVKIVSSSGIDKARNILDSISNNLKPLVLSESPYRNIVCAMVDAPNSKDEKKIEDIRKFLRDRLFVLTEQSIEEYIPQTIYSRAGRNKDEDLFELKRLRGNYLAESDYKKQISSSIADVLEPSDLDSIPVIRDAVTLAISCGR